MPKKLSCGKLTVHVFENLSGEGGGGWVVMGNLLCFFFFFFQHFVLYFSLVSQYLFTQVFVIAI